MYLSIFVCVLLQSVSLEVDFPFKYILFYIQFSVYYFYYYYYSTQSAKSRAS